MCACTCASKSTQRGPASQQERRAKEHLVRRSARGFARWVEQHFETTTEGAASAVGIARSTLGRWQERAAARPRGRPAVRVDRLTRREILTVIRAEGAIGVPALQARFPGVARRELEHIRRRCTWAQRLFAPKSLCLSWTMAGSVWAMDHSKAPAPIDGEFRDFLAVRDLSSHEQLEALPTLNVGATEVVQTLARLFRVHGAPLVIKIDNGSGFIAIEVELLCASEGVLILRSPPYTPSYNGSVEAGNGSMKTRAERRAAAQGRPGCWTTDDLEHARLQANATALPHGPRGPTPDEAWASRKPITPELRAAMHERYRFHVAALAAEMGIAKEVSPSKADLARIDRAAIASALADLDLLNYRRR